MGESPIRLCSHAGALSPESRLKAFVWLSLNQLSPRYQKIAPPRTARSSVSPQPIANKRKAVDVFEFRDTMTRPGSESQKTILQPMDAGQARLSEGDQLAADLRGFGPIGIVAVFVIFFTGNVKVGSMVALPIGAFLVMIWAWRSRTPWRAIGYVRPKSWLRTLAAGIVFGCAFKIVMKMLVMPLLGADPINHAYHFLAGNRAMLPAAIWAMLVAGFAEETVFRGFLFERSSKLFGCSGAAKALTVLVTSGLFGLAHYADQGITGAQQGAITGLVFGAIYSVTGRIFLLMCAHSAFDLTALAIIYWNLESSVAHFIFK